MNDGSKPKDDSPGAPPAEKPGKMGAAGGAQDEVMMAEAMAPGDVPPGAFPPDEQLPDGAEPDGMMEAATQEEIDAMMGQEGPPGVSRMYLGKMLRWGWYVVGVARFWFLANAFLSLLVQTLRQYTSHVLATAVAMIAVQSGGAALAAKSTGGFLQSLVPSGLSTTAILFAAVSVGFIFLRLSDALLNVWTDNLMIGRLQHRLHDKMLELGPSYHSQHDLGETTMVITRYATGAQMLLRDLMSFPLLQLIGFGTAVVFLSHHLRLVGETPLWMNVVLLSALVLFPVGGYFIAQKVRAAFEEVRDAEVKLANEFTNSGTSPLEVQVMDAHEQRSEAFAKRIARAIKTKVKAGLRNEVANQFDDSVEVGLITLFLLYAVFHALKSDNPASAGAIVGIIAFVPLALQPIQQLLSFYMGLNTAWPQVSNVIEILEAEPEVRDKPDAEELQVDTAEIVMEDVQFAYTEHGPTILNGLSHRFQTGRTTAIVARSGGGKSTVMNLLLRLRDPVKGTVSLDGQDLKDVTLRSLRRSVVKVSQFPLFVQDTIRINMQLARADATDAEIEAVCRKTGIWEVLEKNAPPGVAALDFVLPRAVGEGLSGGQRRILAVTRALLLTPKVLLLDEPTTGIDAIGRKAVAKVLKEAFPDTTVVLIDHNIEFIRQVTDEICVLEDGQFLQVGTPDTLAKEPGLFHELVQASLMDEEAAPDAAPTDEKA